MKNDPAWGKPREARAEHEKAWLRSKAVAWDDRWQALSAAARRAYLLDVRPPTREGSTTRPSTPADLIPKPVLDELARAGFVEVEPARGKGAPRAFATRAAYDFSARLRSIHRSDLLATPDRVALANFIRHAFLSQGELTILRVLDEAGLRDSCRLDEALGLYVTTRRWPEWALGSCQSKAARPLLEALIQAPGPVKLAALPAKLKKFNPQEVGKALTDLVAHLAAFEGVDPAGFELVVGLLPEVRDALEKAAGTRGRPPLVVCEHPKEVGPPGGLDVNDLRTFLLEVAGEAPRLRQDGGIFAKDEPRLLDALLPHPAWLDEALKTSTEQRLDKAHAHALTLKFVEVEDDDRAKFLRLSGKGRTWLAAGFEEQYARFYEHYRATSKARRDDGYGYGYDSTFGDAKFLGLPVTVLPVKPGTQRYYYDYEDVTPERRDAQRAALLEVFRALPLGVFHRWDGVLDHACFGEHNPLLRGADPSQVLISIDRRQFPRLPEHAEAAARIVLDLFLRLRLVPFDAVRAAVDAEGKLCVARLARLDGYFGRPYQADEGDRLEAARVIVQPDFSVLVIGLDPSPAAEIAPFCDRAGGRGGQGVMTFKITRASVIRAAGQGLSAPAIVARLQKYASVAVPENVLREIREWAGWVRLVNVRQVTVVRCPDGEAVARVVSALGKKAERLGDSLVALQVPKLTSLERQKLRDHGILVTKDDIAVAPQAKEGPAPKKRGRPRKVP